MSILINASAAKYGGALTILEDTLDLISERHTKIDITVICPNNVVVPSNIKHIVYETTGFNTVFFALFGIYYYVVKLRPSSLVSFSNINCAFKIPWCKRITYFHQLKYFDDHSPRFRLLRTITRLQYKNTIYVFQTNFVKNMFSDVFGNPASSLVSWPGAAKCNHDVLNYQKKTAIIPYVDIMATHKNFKFLVDRARELSNIFDHVYVTSPSQDISTHSNFFKFIGKLKRCDLFDLYSRAQVMLITSTKETVCLPIFEFASTGKPVVVLRSAYIESIETTKLPPNIFIVNHDQFIEKCKHVVEFYNESVCNDAMVSSKMSECEDYFVSFLVGDENLA